MKRILIHARKHGDLTPVIAARFPELDIRGVPTYDDLIRALEDFRPEALFSIREGAAYPRDAVLACASLKWLTIGGVGVDHIAPWDPKALTVSNSVGVAGFSMAEFVLGGLVALGFNFPALAEDKAQRRWEGRAVRPLAGKTLAVIGLGGTGTEVARLARADQDGGRHHE